MLNIVSKAEIVTIISAISIDTFGAALTYGTGGVNISAKSSAVIHTLSSLFIAVSYIAGTFLSNLISPALTSTITVMALGIIGTAKLFDSIIKNILLKSKAHKKDISFSLMSLKFILSVYADPIVADADNSKSLSAKEAAVLAITLSLDNFPVGVGLGLSAFPILCLIPSIIIAEEIALRIGIILGRKISEKSGHDISWIGGALLLILAFTKLL